MTQRHFRANIASAKRRYDRLVEEGEAVPKGRILLVEDDPDVRQLLGDVLSSEGYALDMAETVLKAVSLLETNSYDLVLTDGVLPDGHGMAIADIAKARGVKALIFSGEAPAGAKQNLQRHDYMIKPVPQRVLLDAVARVLRSAVAG
jgi:two-component system, OmpR family, response regulator